jgi:putative component of membrane protein insertase Oxa1/YidC/SpoIIIJ protein YidD
VPDELRPRVARKLGLPLEWDLAVDALPSPPLSAGGLGAAFCRLYRRLRPRSIGDRCAFEPSCSRYAEISFRAFGFWRGLSLAMGRLRRCKANAGGRDLPPGLCGCSSHLKEKIDEVQS